MPGLDQFMNLAPYYAVVTSVVVTSVTC